MKSPRLNRFIGFVTLVCMVCALAFCCGVPSSGAAFAAIPNNYLTQWQDAEEYLDYVGTLEKIQSEIMSKSNLANFVGDPVTVAVIDTGINRNHEVFEGILDYDNGYDYVNNDAFADDDSVSPDSHGTHVAGIVAREIIKYGLEDYVNILPIKAGNSSGEFSSTNTIKAIDYAIYQGVDVINMSFREYGNNSNWGANSALASKVKEAVDAGIIVVAAAGNDGKLSSSTSSTIAYPAAIDGVIGVMSYNADGTLSSDFNYGRAYDVVAPGKNILSALKGSNIEYGTKNGTSMAAPEVSFMAAVLMLKYNKNARVVNYVFDNCTLEKVVYDSISFDKASLKSYLSYDELYEINASAVGGDTEMQLNRIEEINFAASITEFESDTVLDVESSVYEGLTWYADKVNSDDDFMKNVATVRGSTMTFTPVEAGRYKIYAKSDSVNYIAGEPVFVNVSFASFEEIKPSLAVIGKDQVLRAHSEATFVIANFEYLNPQVTEAHWSVYDKDNNRVCSGNGAKLTFNVATPGEYKVVCEIYAGEDSFSDTFTVSVKMSKEKAANIAAGVISGLLLAGVSATEIAAIVKAVLSRRAA